MHDPVLTLAFMYTLIDVITANPNQTLTITFLRIYNELKAAVENLNSCYSSVLISPRFRFKCHYSALTARGWF